MTIYFGRDIIMNNFCFVAQPFDQGKFDQRYRDVIRPVIESLGLYAYRVDEDFSVEIPINTIESKISAARVVVAEITMDNPNVWFELGYALALAKPIILLCSDERKTPFPFDVRHRNIITYHTGSLGDFEEYRLKLKKAMSVRCGIHTDDSAAYQNVVTPEELLILKFINRDQKTSFAITPEEKIMQSSLRRDQISDCLKSLIKQGYLEYRYSTTSGEGYYHITSRAEQVLNI